MALSDQCNRARLCPLAARHNLPAVYYERVFVTAGRLDFLWA
jgi:hypothetical protein